MTRTPIRLGHGGVAAKRGGVLWAGVPGGALVDAPYGDDIHTALAWPAGYERSLSKLAKRMGELPKRVAAEITQV